MNKPSITIYKNTMNDWIIKEICAGLEEEGVLFEIINSDLTSLDVLSITASNKSILGCGIGILDDAAAISIVGFRTGEYLMESDTNYRIIGINAARHVKKTKYVI